MKQNLDDRLYEAFAQDVQLPDALDERLAQCYRRVRLESQKGDAMKHANHKPNRKALRTALALAAAICVLAGAALAVADYTGFFESAYGDGIAAQQAHDVPIVNDEGEVVKTEHYPTIDRAPVDTEQASELIGDYVSAVGQSVTVRGYTFTIRECVMDENGIGAVTIDVENPDGVSQQTAFDGAAGESAPYNIVFGQPSEGGVWDFDDRGFIDESASTDTCVRWVYYLIARDTLEDDITVQVAVHKGESDADKAPLFETAELTIPQSEYVPAARFTGGNFEAELSPVGITLRVTDMETDGYIDLSAKDLVIRYADGSEYIVQGEDLYSTSVGFLRHNGEVCLSLNRLVDVDNVTEIYLRGHYYVSVPVDMVETVITNEIGMTEVVETPADPTQVVEPEIIDFDLTLTR